MFVDTLQEIASDLTQTMLNGIRADKNFHPSGELLLF